MTHVRNLLLGTAFARHHDNRFRADSARAADGPRRGRLRPDVDADAGRPGRAGRAAGTSGAAGTRRAGVE